MVSIVFLSSHNLNLTKVCVDSVTKALTRAAPEGFKCEIIVGYQCEERGRELKRLYQNYTATHFNLSQVPPNLHPPQARNFLLKLRSPDCKWILFVDDDVEIPPNFFVEFTRLKKLWPDATLFGGPNLTPAYQKGLARDSGWLLASPLNFVCRNRYGRGREGVRRSARDFILCNLFVRADISPEFALSLPLGEELGLIRRLIEKGAICIYSPNLAVFHFRRETMGQILAQMEKYGLGRGLASWEDGMRGIMFGLTFVVGLSCICFFLSPTILFSLYSINEEDRHSSFINWIALIHLIPAYYLKGLFAGYVFRLKHNFSAFGSYAQLP